MNKMLVHAPEGQRLYDAARAKGIKFLRINSRDDVRVEQNKNKIEFELKESTLKKVLLSFDSGWLIIPEKVQSKDTYARITDLLNDQMDCEGFLQSANIRHRPINSPRKGIFYTGSCHDDVDDNDLAFELELILNSIQEICHPKHVSSMSDMEINTQKCKKCLTCFRICPHGAVILNKKMQPFIVPEACFSCGLCLSSCPALAIESKAVADASCLTCATETEIVIFACERSGAPAAANIENSSNINLQKVPCVCRVSQNLLLKTFELGVRKIILAGCHPDNCQSIKGSQNGLILAKKTAQIPGIDESDIIFYPVAANESVKFETFLAHNFLAN